MKYVFNREQLEGLIKKFVGNHFFNDKNFQIVKNVKFVEVSESDELIEYRIFLELVDDLLPYLTKYRIYSNFLPQYDGYALYGMEVESAIRTYKNNLPQSFRDVDVYQLFRDINDFIYTHMGFRLHPTLCTTYFFMSK